MSIKLALGQSTQIDSIHVGDILPPMMPPHGGGPLTVKPLPNSPLVTVIPGPSYNSNPSILLNNLIIELKHDLLPILELARDLTSLLPRVGGNTAAAINTTILNWSEALALENLPTFSLTNQTLSTLHFDSLSLLNDRNTVRQIHQLLTQIESLELSALGLKNGTSLSESSYQQINIPILNPALQQTPYSSRVQEQTRLQPRTTQEMLTPRKIPYDVRRPQEEKRVGLLRKLLARLQAMLRRVVAIRGGY